MPAAALVSGIMTSFPIFAATDDSNADFTEWEEVGTGTYTDIDNNAESGKTLMMRRSKTDSNLGV